MVMHQIMTRTVAVGKPDDFKKKIYLDVKAQQAAIDMIKPGVTAHDVDRAYRASSKAGYSDTSPSPDTGSYGCAANFLLLRKNDMVLEEGICFS